MDWKLAAVLLCLFATSAGGMAQEWFFDGYGLVKFTSSSQSYSHGSYFYEILESGYYIPSPGSVVWNQVPAWMITTYGVTSLYESGLTQDPRGQMVPVVRAQYSNAPLSTGDGSDPTMNQELACKVARFALTTYGLVVGADVPMQEIFVVGEKASGKLLLPITAKSGGYRVDIKIGKMLALSDDRGSVKNSVYLDITPPGRSQPETGFSMTFIDNPMTPELEWIPAFVIIV